MLSLVLSHYRDAYSGLPRPVWFLSAVILANRIGSMVIPFLALYLTRQVGIPVEQGGALLALFGVGTLVGGYTGGWLCTLFRPTWIQAVMLFFEGASALLLGQAQGVFEFSGLLFSLGFFSEGFRPANAVATTNACNPEVRARAFALNRLAINVGMSIGPAVGGFLAVRNYQWIFIADATTCFCASVFVLFLFRKGEPTVESQKEERSEKILQGHASLRTDGIFWGFIVLLIIALACFFQFESTFLLYLREYYGLVESRLGVLWAVNTILIILFEMILVRRLENAPLLRSMGVGCFLICIGFGIVPFGSTFAFVAFTMVVTTFGEMIFIPLSSAWVSLHAPKKTLGLYMGFFSAGHGVAITTAPLLGMTLYGYHPELIWYLILGMGFVLLAGFWSLAKLEKVRGT